MSMYRLVSLHDQRASLASLSCTYIFNTYTVIAEHLSMRLLILQCVFSVGGVWCHASGMQFVTLRNAIKGVACAQTSVPFRNAIKTSCLQNVVYTYVSLSFPAL